MDVYGLIGNPVAHSLSPPMHEAAYAADDVDARYVVFEPPAEEGPAAIKAANTLGFAGLNVTIPFKESVLTAVDPDPMAQRVGAVNTVTFPGGRPTGHNTDVEGAVRALREHDVELEGMEAVLIGAGGAGRAIGYGLSDAGADLSILNRTVERAETLAAELPGATAGGLEAVADYLSDASLLINATSVGMESDLSPVSRDALHSGLTVMDAVYRPLETRLLRDAAAVGAQTIDGAWMLLYQGVAAYELWREEPAPVEAMNAALRQHLE